jgi:hypothetical protein
VDFGRKLQEREMGEREQMGKSEHHECKVFKRHCPGIIYRLSTSYQHKIEGECISHEIS